MATVNDYARTTWQTGDVIDATKMNNIETQLDAVTDNARDNGTAPVFSTTKTYAVGEHVLYNGEVYRCKTAVTNAGAWVASNWVKAYLSSDMEGEVSELKSAITITGKPISNEVAQWTVGGIGSSGENYGSRKTSIFTKNYIPIQDVGKLICEDLSLVYVSLYDSEYNHIRRYQISIAEVDISTLTGYSSAEYVRVELKNTELADYSKLKNELPINANFNLMEENISSIQTELADFPKPQEKTIEKLSYVKAYSGGGSLHTDAKCCTFIFPAIENTQYSISKLAGNRTQVLFSDTLQANKNFTYFDSIEYSNSFLGDVDFVTPEGTKLIGFYAYNGNSLDIPTLEANITLSVSETQDVTAREKIESLRSDMPQLTDRNRQQLWELNGIGSIGENFKRAYAIRTINKISYEKNAEIVVKTGSRIYFARYDSDGEFINRSTYGEGTYKLKDMTTTNAETFRIEINLVDSEGNVITTPLADTSIYNYVELNCLYDFIDDETSKSVIENEEAKYNDLLSQARYIYASTDSGTTTQKPLTLLHFSDVHGNLAGMKYALGIFDTYSDKIDDAIHTGDTVVANFSNGIANWISSGCAERVLNVIGNHDTEENLVLQAAGKDNVYNTIFAPYIANWGVVQPTGVDDSTSADYHALYYYKDYSASSVRLIVTDTNFWDARQKEWLSETLDDALANNLCVVLACHNVKKLTEMTESNFSAYPGNGINETGNAYANQPDDWLDPVKDFMDAGGNFACILAGHNHSGHMGTMTNYPDVFVFVSDKASVARTSGAARISGENNANTVNIVTINPVEKLFKIVKIGAEVDGKMRGKHVFCYDYANKRIISQWYF